MALRGNDESALSENRGVFSGLIDLIEEDFPTLKDHVDKERGRGSVSYLSNTSQNELLDGCYAVYQIEIKKQIKDAQYLAIMADETTDTSQTTQLVIVFRYIFMNEIREQFWVFLKSGFD